MCWVIKKVKDGYEVGYFYTEEYYVDFDKRTQYMWACLYNAKNMEDAFAVCSYLNGGIRP